MESSGFPVRLRGRAARLVPAARVAGFLAAVAIVVVIGVRAAQDIHADRLTWWPLPVALLAATGWWLLLARGWAVLVTGRSTAADVATWCRTQPLRFLPGGVWAPASRVTIVRGGWLDRLSTVAAENVIALCAALAVGGAALAAGGAPLWLPLVLALAAPAVGSRLVAQRTRLDSARTRRATVNYLVAFLGYALAALLVQGAVSGFHDSASVAGAAAVAWAAGLVAVFAPGGVGIRELAYVGLLSHTLPSGELAAGAVVLRIVTIAAELGVLVVVGRPRIDGEAIRRALAPTLALARRHALFLGLLGAGIAARVVTTIAYRPAILSYDSQGFLWNAAHLRPDPVRPLGYPLFLWILGRVHHLAVVPAVQHLMGLAMAVLIYALLVRLRVPRWAAALAAAPVLLDAYQLEIEHYVLAETLFEALLVAGCAALLWRRRPGLVDAGLAGLCFAGVALTRANGLVVIAPALIAVLALRWRVGAGLARGIRPALPVAGALLAAFAVPLAAYGLWFHRLHGHFGITDYGGRFLYARVTPFVDCSKFKVPINERALCPINPVGKRPTMAGSTVEYYMWHFNSPVWHVKIHLTGDFARRVIIHQPLDYLRTVSHDFLRGFAPIRTAEPGELPISRWQFQPSYPIFLETTDALIRSRGGSGAAVDYGLASFLAGYRRFVFAPGPWLALGLIAGLLAALGLGRARRSGLRAASFLFASTGFVVFASTVVSNQFSWRYVLPMLVLLPPAASLGLTALLRRPAPRTAPAADDAGRPPEGAPIADPVSG